MASLYESRREQMFPKLTPAQLTRIEAYGEKVRIRAPDLLTESGERYERIVVVLSGSIEVVRPGLSGEGPITALSRGDFTGEMSALRGSASLVRIRVLEDGEAIAISHESLRSLVQTDSELSELFMRRRIARANENHIALLRGYQPHAAQNECLRHRSADSCAGTRQSSHLPGFFRTCSPRQITTGTSSMPT